MQRNRNRKMAFPPVLKLLLRGYIVMAFVLAMWHFNVITHIPFIIFLVTVVSISMVFGVGYLLVMDSRPIRASTFDIPNTVLFFVKGIMVLYFVSLIGQFELLPERMTSMLMLAISTILVVAGVASYLWEVFERSSPLPKPKIASKPRTR